MRNIPLAIAAVLSLIVFSCKKDAETPVPVTKADYYQLKVGNYWIYQGYMIDTNGLATPSGEFDSAYIEKDTIINNYTYYKYLESPYVIIPMQIPYFLRDSSGYLVSHDGIILASDVNFTDTLAVDTTHPDLYIGYQKMTGKDSLVTTAAGTFQSITTRRQIVPVEPNPLNLPIRYLYDVYGKGVGKMKTHTFFFSGGATLEARLERFKVN
jgi:hypothetical protein